ncbi:MAG: 3-deoxy-7-phosphoheptulonate synthase [Bryobacteraceae bacterium]
MHYTTDDVRILGIKELVSPVQLLSEYPCSDEASKLIYETRQAFHDILHGSDDRLVVVVGPCSIHDPQSALEYARRLKEAARQHYNELLVVMRVYFEKPRTTVGWKGLINDPNLDGTFQINHGLRTARQLLRDINHLGLPASTEFLDMITPQYVADFISWGAIGARTTESQVHRELASGLSCPVGFKNGTDGNIRIAIDAVRAARDSHHFLSVTKTGHTAIVETRGNPDCHVILRGGKEPNWDAASVESAARDLKKRNLPHRLMIDCSHSNSRKDYRLQIQVAEGVAKQIADGGADILGVMVESNLVAGRQDLAPGKAPVFGQSITDGCIGWDETEYVLSLFARAKQMQPQAVAS